MTDTVFNTQNMFSISQGEAILDKQEETLNQLVSRLPPCPPTSRSGSGSGSSHFDDDSPTNVSKSGSVYVLWHNVTSQEEWLASIQSLSLPHFSAMLGSFFFSVLLSRSSLQFSLLFFRTNKMFSLLFCSISSRFFNLHYNSVVKWKWWCIV